MEHVFVIAIATYLRCVYTGDKGGDAGVAVLLSVLLRELVGDG